MSSLQITFPDEIYARLQKLAELSAQPLEKVLLNHLELTLPLLDLPDATVAELEALPQLSDDALRVIAREQMPQDVQARMQVLMDKNSQGTISPGEYQELAGLAQRSDRLMLRKAEAAAILMQRGCRFTQKDFQASRE